MEAPVFEKRAQPIMVQPAATPPLKRKAFSNPLTPLDSPFHKEIRPRSSTRSIQAVNIPIHVESREEPQEEIPATWIECPFKAHGCQKKGEKTDVKRHVRDDRNLHLVLLCLSLNPIRSKINVQQSEYVDKYVGMLHTMSTVESAFEKFGSQHTFHVPQIGLSIVKATKSKAHRSIYSQPFHSHGYGYKMMAVAAPYGDGLAFREYFSVFVCLMKGEWDDILEWPFRCDVTFSVLSRDRKELLARTINVNEMKDIEEFLERPHGLRNGTFGFQDFVPLTKINDFAADGDIYIRIRVHLSREKLFQAREIDSEQCQGEQLLGEKKTKND